MAIDLDQPAEQMQELERRGAEKLLCLGERLWYTIQQKQERTFYSRLVQGLVLVWGFAAVPIIWLSERPLLLGVLALSAATICTAFVLELLVNRMTIEMRRERKALEQVLFQLYEMSSLFGRGSRWPAEAAEFRIRLSRLRPDGLDERVSTYPRKKKPRSMG